MIFEVEQKILEAIRIMRKDKCGSIFSSVIYYENGEGIFYKYEIEKQSCSPQSQEKGDKK
jgi:hypothetical protein